MPRFKSVGDILDFAIAREIEAHDLYVGLAGLVTKPELRGAVEGFALDEVRHRIRLEAVKAGEMVFTDDEVGNLHIAESVKEVRPHPEMSYTDLLVVAMTKEKAAFRLYTNLASIAKEQALRDMLLKLAQEEAGHKLRLEIEYDWATF